MERRIKFAIILYSIDFQWLDDELRKFATFLYIGKRDKGSFFLGGYLW